jgi:ribosomal protein S18 acetylase RimI-like enzyme
MKFQFQSAKKDQAEDLSAVYRRAAKNMNDKKVFQWNSSYPNHETALEDINQGWLFVLQGEAGPAAVITLNQSLDIPEEEKYGISWQGEGPYGVIHRFCVDPKYQGQGLGKQILRSAGEYAAGRGWQSLRLMVMEANRFALGLYSRMGFEVRGEFPVENHGKFLFMEKSLSPVLEKLG